MTRDLNMTDDLDFEIVTGPDTPSNTPPPSVEETSEREQLIEELPNEPKETDLIQDAARVILKLSLPFTLAWNTFIAVVANVYKRDSDDRSLECVSETLQSTLTSYTARLNWVDEKLPEHVSKYKSNIRKGLTEARSAVKERMIDGSCIPNRLSCGLYFLGLCLLLQLIWPMLRYGFRVRGPCCGLGWMSIWITIAGVVKLKKSRRKIYKRKCVKK